MFNDCRTLDYFCLSNCADMSFSSSTPQCGLSSSILMAKPVLLVHGGEAQHTVQCRNRHKPTVWSHMSGGESESWGVAESQRNIEDLLKNNCDCVCVCVSFLQLHTSECPSSFFSPATMEKISTLKQQHKSSVVNVAILVLQGQRKECL